MTVSGVRYGHQTAPWDSPLGFGIQSLIEYNGYVLNDRYQEDRIRVTQITGLDDADVRDAREARASDHGEFAYDAFYGGRTLVLTGEMQAGSLPNLKRLERDLKAAFAPLSEAPLKFRWFDVYDSFDDPADIGNYSVVYNNLILKNHFDGSLTGLTGWTAGATTFVNVGSTMTQVITQAHTGAGSMQVVTTNALSLEGVSYQVPLPRTFTAGIPVTFSTWMKGNVGGEVVKLTMGVGGNSATSANLTLTTAWQLFSVTWTPTADVSTQVLCSISTASAIVQTWFVDDPIATPSLLLYPMSIVNNTLQWPSGPAQVILTRTSEQRLYGDNQQTLLVTAGIDSTDSNINIYPKIKDANNYVLCSVGQGVLGAWGCGPSAVVNGSPATMSTPVSSGSISAGLPGDRFWLRGKIEGDLVTAEFWKTPPSDDAAPDFQSSAYLLGSDADLLGDGVVSSVGIGGSPADTSWTIDDHQIQSLYPGDVMFSARKLSPLSIGEQQQSLTRFKRSFQITMRTSNFRAQGATQSRSRVLIPTSGSNPVQGFQFPLKFPLRFNSFFPNTISRANNVLSVNNRGTVFMRPKIIVYGATSALTIINLTNGDQISWGGTITDGDFMIFDCDNRTIVNSQGVNNIQFLTPNVQWLRLEPGWNDIFIAGGSYSGNTRAFLFFRNCWL